MEAPSTSAKPGAAPPLPTREASQRKRIRKTMGPDFIEDFFPGISRASSTLSEAEAVRRALKASTKVENVDIAAEVDSILPIMCKECFKEELTEAAQNKMMRCTGSFCDYAAHSDCIGVIPGSESLVSTAFKCMDCKRCITCGKGRVILDNKLIHCSKCARIFHMRCHHPPVEINSTGLTGKYLCFSTDWQCSSCKSSVDKNGKTPGKGVAGKKTTGENSLSNSHAESGSRRIRSRKFKSSRLANLRGKRAREVEEQEPEPEEADEIPESPRSQSDGSLNGIGDLEASVTGSSTGGEDEFESAVEEQMRRGQANEERCQEERELRQDLSLWSVDQCAAYFADSHRELADLIRRHELYGSSLIVMSRAQFTNLFGLSVGKNLKLFSAICKWRKITF